MPNIADYLKYAETAFAAYAENLSIGAGVNAATYKRAGMVATQAQHFDTAWQVLGQQDLWDGFSAVLLQPVNEQGNPSGQKVLAIRGTEGGHWGIDYLVDVVNITLLGTSAGMRQYASLESFYQSLIAENKLGAAESIVTTGHSLGGFLAQAFAGQHSTVSAAYTYNAPGFTATLGMPNLGTELLKLFGLSGTIPNDKIFNARALDGFSATAGLGQMIGSVQTFNIEGSANPISNHSIKTLADALAVYDLYARVDASVSLDSVGSLLKAASSNSADTLEAATKALNKIFIGSEPVIPADNRDALFEALYGLQSNGAFKALAGNAKIELLAGKSADAVSALAKSELAYRYALQELNPFAILGADYSAHNTDGKLDLYDPETGKGDLTGSYLADRAAFLANVIQANTDDTGSGKALRVDVVSSDTAYFEDKTSGMTVQQVNALNGDSHGPQYIFGGDDADSITGGDYKDHLYGMAGNDVFDGGKDDDQLYGGGDDDDLTGGTGQDKLYGGIGNDVLHGDDGAGGDLLEGGAGLDTYYADEGDTIRDSDGKGTVYLNDKQLTHATRKKGETAYKDAAGNVYILNGSTLQVNGPLTIQNFTAGDLGIELEEKLDPDDPDEPPLKDPFKKAESTKSPVVLDLDGNGIATRGIGEGAFFDYDGNGFAERTGWVNTGDGLLVRDLNANGKIDTGAELFGDHTRLKNGTLAANGYTALADLDDNHDGKLDSQDAAFAELKIWRDANSDGLTQIGELKTLEESGIQSLATAYTGINTTDAHGNQHLQQGSFTKADGSSGQTQDIWFRTNNASTRQDNPLELLEAIRALPEIKGMGNVASLRQVIAQQAANGSHHLKDLVEQFANESDLVARQELTTKIIYAWTGVEDKDPLSRAQTRYYGNTIGDARKLYAMEALLGEAYEGTWCWGEKDPNPHGPASAVLLKAFDQYANGIAAQLMQQTRMKDLYSAIRYTWDESSQSVKGDLSGTLPLIVAKIVANHEQGKVEMAAFITNLTYTNNVNEFDTRSFQVALESLGNDVVAVAGMAWRGMVATQGSDRLTGDGNDEIIAGWGGNDFIQGGGGNDRLLGEQGDDRLYGQDGNDTLDGGVGSDLLDGGTGNDIYLFGRGAGQDTIYSQDGTANKRDTLKFDAGIAVSDIGLIRNADDLVLTVRDSGDRMTVAGYFTNDGVSASSLETIEFEDGTLWNFASVKGMLPPVGTEGNDRIRGYNTAEVIEGLGGDDVIEGRGGDDTLKGGTGNDTLDGGAGDDVLDGGIGNDSLQGGVGNDTYVFGNGYGLDVINDADGTVGNIDSVQMVEGVAPADVTVTRDQYHLYLSLNGGADRLTLQNWFYGDAYKIERIVFADNTVWDTATLLAKANVPTENADYIEGTSGNNVIVGLGGNDQILGYGGNDTLDGGSGNDNLQGGAGNDTYLFGSGSGQDVIYDIDGTAGNLDTVQMAEGITPADVKVMRDAGNLYLSLNGGADRLTLQNWFSGDAYKVERIVFADNTVWDTAALLAKANVATEVADYIEGTSGDNVIDGLGGNDQILGYGGNDTLDGGSGNDSLDGGNGNDTYLFGRGDGQDTIASWESNQNKQDVVQFKAGVLPTDIVVSRNGNNLILKIAGTPDQLTVQNYFYNDGAFNPAGIESIQFADGSPAWNYATVKVKSLIGSEGSDSLTGFNADDTIKGLGGNDQIAGYGGNDTLDGGSGNDSLDGGNGNDTYLFGRGDGQDTIASWESNQNKQDVVQFKAGISPADVVASRQGDSLILKIVGTQDQLTIQNYFYNDGAFNSAGIESIQFADGSPAWNYATVRAKMVAGSAGNDSMVGFNSDDVIDGLDGNDSIEGRGGNDTLDGGSGADQLDGGNGNDTYLFGRGDGQDTIASWESNQNKQDVVQFKAGVSPTDVVASRQWDNLILKIAGTPDELTLQNYFYNDGAFNPAGIESIQFADGSSAWNYATVRTKMLAGSAGNDSLVGFNSDDTINGLDGNDQIVGYGGNDTLDGGSGNDYLDGGNGNDTYLFGRGDGQDTIASWEDNQNKQDSVRFKAGVSPTDIVASRNSNNLILRIAGTPDQLTVQNYFYNDGAFNPAGIEAIQFADGSPAWDYAMVRAKILAGTAGSDSLSGFNSDDVIDGLGGNDYLYGGASNDTLKGGAGDDQLYGQEGNDTFDGGSGNDYLDGGNGNDTYLFGRGDGQDTIAGWELNQNKQDVVRFKAGVSPDNIVASRQGDNLILKIAGTQDQLTVPDYFYNDGAFNPAGIESIQFADGGSAWGYAEVKARLAGATEGEDNLYGYNADDVIDGLGGNDSIDGYGGNDILKGGAGDDQLYGQKGNDTLDGGFGNDTLIGGAGDDIYVFGRGSGQDVINDYSGWVGEDNDAVSFAPGISPDDLWLTQEGDDLLVRVLGGSDQLRICGYFVDTSGGYGDGYGGGYGGSYGSTHPDVIEELRFSDGTTWHMADVRQHLAGSGSELDDSWVGTAGNDLFAGKGGNDQLNGGAGNDNLRGDAGNDQLTGGIGNDVLDGGAGADVMRGDAGDDIYFVDNADDQVVEKSNNGIDTVKSIITYALGSNLENLVLLGSSDVDGSGNSLSNRLVGNDGVNALSGGGGADQLYGAAGDDVLDGGAGVDLLVGGSGNDTYVITAGDSVVEQAGEGFDTVQSSASYILPENVEVLILTGNGSLSGTGNAGNNLIHGGGGSNRLEGGAGIDVLEGGAGADTLVDVSAEAALFNGGGGADTLSGGAGSELYLGGAGSDTLMVGTGRDVILFNLGDGKDEVLADAGASATLSLGGGIRYADLSLSKKGNDLVLKTGSKDQISFKDWYVATDHRSVTNLQVIAEAMAAFDAASSDPLLNRKVEAFDFGGLAEAFDVARTANPGLTSWALTNGLAKFHLSGSDSAALGGDLAYQYGKSGTLSGIGLTAAQQAIGNVNFGAQAQSLQPLSGLQDGLSRLA